MSDLNLFLAESNKDFKIVTVVYPNSKQPYTYKTTLDVKAEDLVVVHTPSGEYKVVEVVDAVPALETDLNFNFQVKWIVSKVDVDNYKRCIEVEREANKHLNRLKYTKQRATLLDQMREEIGADDVQQITKLVRL